MSFARFQALRSWLFTHRVRLRSFAMMFGGSRRLPNEHRTKPQGCRSKNQSNVGSVKRQNSSVASSPGECDSFDEASSHDDNGGDREQRLTGVRDDSPVAEVGAVDVGSSMATTGRWHVKTRKAAGQVLRPATPVFLRMRSVVLALRHKLPWLQGSWTLVYYPEHQVGAVPSCYDELLASVRAKIRHPVSNWRDGQKVCPMKALACRVNDWSVPLGTFTPLWFAPGDLKVRGMEEPIEGVDCFAIILFTRSSPRDVLTEVGHVMLMTRKPELVDVPLGSECLEHAFATAPTKGEEPVVDTSPEQPRPAVVEVPHAKEVEFLCVEAAHNLVNRGVVLGLQDESAIRASVASMRKEYQYRLSTIPEAKVTELLRDESYGEHLAAGMAKGIRLARSAIRVEKKTLMHRVGEKASDTEENLEQMVHDRELVGLGWSWFDWCLFVLMICCLVQSVRLRLPMLKCVAAVPLIILAVRMVRRWRKKRAYMAQVDSAGVTAQQATPSGWGWFDTSLLLWTIFGAVQGFCFHMPVFRKGAVVLSVILVFRALLRRRRNRAILNPALAGFSQGEVDCSSWRVKDFLKEVRARVGRIGKFCLHGRDKKHCVLCERHVCGELYPHLSVDGSDWASLPCIVLSSLSIGLNSTAACFRRQCENVRMYCYGVSIKDALYCHRNTPHQVEMAFMARQAGHLGVSDSSCLRWFNEFCRNCLPRQVETMKMDTYLTSLGSRTRAKMVAILDLFPQWLELPFDQVLRAVRFTVFGKHEKLLRTGPQLKDTRIISYLPAIFTLETGPTIQALYKALCHLWSPESAISIGSGMTPDALGFWFTKTAELMSTGEYVIVATDVKKCDAHQNVGCYDLFFRCIRWMWRTGPGARRVMKIIEAHRDAVFSLPNGKTVKLKGTLKSGSTFTTLMNSLINAVILYSAARDSGAPWGSFRIIVAGDDGLLVIPRRYVQSLALTEVSRRFGHEFKQEVVDSLGATFLSCHFWPVEPYETLWGVASWKAAPIFTRVLAKCAWSDEPSVSLTWLREIGQAYAAVFSGVPGFEHAFSDVVSTDLQVPLSAKLHQRCQAGIDAFVARYGFDPDLVPRGIVHQRVVLVPGDEPWLLACCRFDRQFAF